MVEERIRQGREILAALRKQQQRAQGLLESLLRAARAGELLPREELGELTLLLAELDKNEGELGACVQRKRMPRKLVEIEHYFEGEERTLAALDVIERAKQFFSLQGKTDAAEKELTAAQKRLQTKLAAQESAQKIAAGVAPYLDFLAMLGETDAIQQLTEINRLTPFFGNLCAYAMRDIALPQETAEAAENRPPAAAEAAEIAASEKAAPQQKISQENVSEASVKAEMPQEKLSWADFCARHEVRLPEDFAFGKLQVEEDEKLAAKTVKASRFFSDLEENRLYIAPSCELLRQMASTTGLLSPQRLAHILDKWSEYGDKEVYQAAAMRLVHKGYLCLVAIEGQNEKPCLAPTRRLEPLLAQEKVRQRLKIHHAKTARIYPDGEPLSLGRAVSLIALERVYTLVLSHFWEKEVAVKAGAVLFPYLVSMRLELFGQAYLAIGCLAPRGAEDAADGEHLLETLRKVAAEGKSYCALLLLGMSFDHAAALYNAIQAEKSLAALTGGETLLYVLPEQQLYSTDGETTDTLPTGEVDEEEATEDDAAEDVAVLPEENAPEEMDEPAAEKGEPAADFAAELPVAAEAGETDAPETEILSAHENAAPRAQEPQDEARAENGSGAVQNAVTEERQPETPPSVAARPVLATAVKTEDKATAAKSVSLTRETAQEAALSLAAEGHLPAAAAFLGYLAARDKKNLPLREQFAYAVNDPALQPDYAADKVYTLFAGAEGEVSSYLLMAAAARSFFYHRQESYADYAVHSLADLTKGTALAEKLPELSDLLYHLSTFKSEQRKGLDFYADYRRRDEKAQQARLAKLQQQAASLYDNLILGKVTEKAAQKRFIETKKILFDRAGDLAACLLAVRDNDTDALPFVQEFLKEKFIKDGAEIDEENIDAQAKLQDMMDAAWEAATARLIRVEHKKLMGALRNNLQSKLEEIARVLCRFARDAESAAGTQDSAGMAAYQKTRAKVLKDIDALLSRGPEETLAARAGYHVLTACLAELRDRLTGSYQLFLHKYFYVEFLRSERVLLDENYLPFFPDWLPEQSPEAVLAAIRDTARADLPTLAERIVQVYEQGGDDFGFAALADAYLRDLSPEKGSFIAAQKYRADAPDYAAQDVKGHMKEFANSLELAQSYGQFASIDQKENMLARVEDCQSYAAQSKNYGVLWRVMDAYKEKIKEEAAGRADVLEKQADAYAEKYEAGRDEDAKKRVARIRQMIAAQNYTVAEDLLNRAPQDEGESEAQLLERDDLADFLARYEENYQKVREAGITLGAILKKRAHNKKERGGAELADHWIAGGGGAREAERITGLLRLLGWRVADVLPQKKVMEMATFAVTLQKPANGRKSSYQHPIAAFGSEAEQKGLRVVTLFGNYTADALLGQFDKLGATQHTLVLLDFALTLADRRRLARKIKEKAYGKIFLVIDRVVMAYLIEHYDATQMSRMLLAITLPFSYAQPYVFESANVMPPELFMGRGRELAAIEDPNGVNIVYGGRQLGKSALLKMARTEIDHNENGDRAILVDIKEKDAAQAARKVSQALSDAQFFTEELDTDDWETLCRAIKQRLAAPDRGIGYFLLMLDEADRFIESAGETNYAPLDALKDVQGIGEGRFKFVIAGLRNVVHFNRDRALGNNSVLTHLSAMTVKPFKVGEARELLELPLYYLGFRFPHGADAPPLVPMILASTNYFPGLIQLYCAKLIEAMTRRDYAGYEQNSAPLYEITEKHIKSVLDDRDFKEQIKEKFIITLRLGSDNAYYILALLLAELCHEHGSGSGYTAADVMEEARSWGSTGAYFYTLKEEQIAALMDELVELNVLRQTGGRYLFARQTFFQMMGDGSQEEVENKLLEVLENG